MNRWTHIILHHSLTKDGETVSWQAIRRWHMGRVPDSPYVTNPMTDIGYHFGIEMVNNEYEILAGRSLIRDGAHCIGMNDRAIGVCFVGNFDVDPVPSEQWQKGLELVKALATIFAVRIWYVQGHRDYAQKSCPGKFFDIEKFRQDLWKVEL